jgi:hypothetical protein
MTEKVFRTSITLNTFLTFATMIGVSLLGFFGNRFVQNIDEKVSKIDKIEVVDKKIDLYNQRFELFQEKNKTDCDRLTKLENTFDIQDSRITKIEYNLFGTAYSVTKTKVK